MVGKWCSSNLTRLEVEAGLESQVLALPLCCDVGKSHPLLALYFFICETKGWSIHAESSIPERAHLYPVTLLTSLMPA